MAIAKGTITLNNLTDSLTVLISPSSCVISTDYNGGNPDLTNAYAEVTVMRGSALVGFTLSFASSSNQGIGYSIIDTDSYHKRIAVTSLPNGIVSGALAFNLVTQDGYFTQVNFQFAVMRESSMFDWIQDWESNKTTIGSTYLITPKIFVGHRTASGPGLGTLSGVYIGPDDQYIGTVGMYGLYEGEEIFHINKDGGVIGGWTIGTDYLYSSHVLLGADTSYVGLSPYELTESIVSANGFSHRAVVREHGGVALFYELDANNNVADYGLEGYLPAIESHGRLLYQKTFSLGSENKIASWFFDTEALWIGAKSNSANSFTSTSSSITIGTNGLRGYKWRLESDGVAVFAGGAVSFAVNGSGYVANQNLSWSMTGAVTACGGKVVFNPDGSGHVANGNLSWSTSGAISACDGKVAFNTDGSGYVANQNIIWDASGNIEFAGSSMELTGAIYVKDYEGTIMAGMLATGTGTSGIRFFAGDSTPSSAPFRVDEFGHLYASDVDLYGKITSTSGSIGRWKIGNSYLFSTHVLLASLSSYIGISPAILTDTTVSAQGYSHRDQVHSYGGVAMFFTSNNDFGLEGYLPSSNKIFSLGSENKIAEWNFDNNALYTGTKTLTGFTSQSGHITMSSSGIRGYKWRLENTGEAVFANGKVILRDDGSGFIANGALYWTTNGGTFISGSLLITDGNLLVRAGISSVGSGSNGIRFFAGGPTLTTAPFRVDENGHVYASDIDADGGYIGNWIINSAENGGTIVSDNSGTPKVTLDASGSIKLYINSMEACVQHMVCGGEGYDRGIGSEIKLDADLGIIKIRTVGDVAGGIGSVLLTPTGIYADRAGMEAPTSDGTYSQRAAIVGDGKSTLIESSHNNGCDENCIIGVYGTASNTRTTTPAPCYGGFFDGLKMRGLYLGRKVITSTGSHQLDGKDTLVIALPQVNGTSANIYLPTEGAYEGRTVIVKLLNSGEATVYPGSGSYMNSTTNTNGIMIANGETWVFILVKIPVTTSGSGSGGTSGDQHIVTPGTGTTTYYNVWTSMKASNK